MASLLDDSWPDDDPRADDPAWRAAVLADAADAEQAMSDEVLIATFASTLRLAKTTRHKYTRCLWEFKEFLASWGVDSVRFAHRRDVRGRNRRAHRSRLRRRARRRRGVRGDLCRDQAGGARRIAGDEGAPTPCCGVAGWRARRRDGKAVGRALRLGRGARGDGRLRRAPAAELGHGVTISDCRSQGNNDRHCDKDEPQLPGLSKETKGPGLAGPSEVGGTGLEPVTPSLSIETTHRSLVAANAQTAR